MTSATFRLTWPLSELHTSNHREHWAVTARKATNMRMAARFACNPLPKLSAPVALTVTFAWPDRRPRDLDNVSIKAAIDGATDAGVIPDDRSTVLKSVTRQCAESLAPKGHVVLTFAFSEVGAACVETDESGTLKSVKRPRPKRLNAPTGASSKPDSPGRDVAP